MAADSPQHHALIAQSGPAQAAENGQPESGYDDCAIIQGDAPERLTAGTRKANEQRSAYSPWLTPL